MSLRSAGVELRPAYPVQTSRLRMRPLRADDLEPLLAYRGDPEVCRHLPFAPMDEAVLSERLAQDLGRREITAEGQSLTLGLELAATGQVIGDVVLFFHSAEHRSGEIGYVLNPAFGGHGYATEAAAAMLDLAFAPEWGLALHRVTARMVSTNVSSARLASRLGMRQEAHHRSSEVFKGSWIDVLVYAVLAEEWRSRSTLG